MASEKSLQDSFSDHSPRRRRGDSTSSSSISSNNTKNTTKSNKCQRNSACSEYSEDFEDNSSIVESFKEGSVKSEHQAIKKESTTKNNNQSNQKRAQTKPTVKMLQHLNQSTVVKNKSQNFTKLNQGGQDFDPVTRHILSARLHKTKELKNEVCDLQRELENARLENRLLRQLQYRHMKALVRFEHEQNNLPQLLVRHEGEVQMLKEMLRKSKEQDRNVSKQLKEAESELWKTKNSLQKLKVLCDKKNLGERDDLNWQITNLTKKLELDQQKIQDLEKILELKGKSFNHQLATEHRKTHEALDLIKKLELEQRTLNQMLTEKERQLGVKNIYANRMLLNHSKNMSSPRHKAENVAKAIQTEECFSPISSFSPHNVLPNLEKKAVHCEKETSSEADDEDSKASKRQLRKEDGEMDSEVERLRKEYEQAEKRWKEMAENYIFENLEREKKEKQEKERAAQFLREALERKETGEEEQQKTTEENRDASESRQDGNKEIGETFALNDSPNKTPSRLRRRYRFTEQIENLHQGLPVCKISYAAHMGNKKRQDRQEDEFLDFNSSFNGYEPSFAQLCNRPSELRHQVGDGPSEKPENCLQSTSRNDTKNSIMEKLFRSASTLENKPTKDDEVKAIDNLKQLQRNKQTSRIQVTNKGRLNVLDPELLPVRVLESSTDESEKLVLQSLNK